MSFSLGWSHLLLAAAAWFWISRKTKSGDRRLLRFFGAACIVLCLLTLQDAAWVWDHVPLLQNVEFPWRLLGPVTLCMAMLAAQWGRLLDAVPRWRTAALVAAMALLIIPNLSHLHSKQLVDVDLGFWTPRQLSLRGFESTTLAEVTPKWMQAPPPYTLAAATVRSGEAEIAAPLRTPLSWSSGVNAKVASTIEMSTAWFPGWEARIDGQSVPAGPAAPSGLMTFQVPPGVHTVQVMYGRTPLEKTAEWISIAALLLTILLARAMQVSGQVPRPLAPPGSPAPPGPPAMPGQKAKPVRK